MPWGAGLSSGLTCPVDDQRVGEIRFNEKSCCGKSAKLRKSFCNTKRKHNVKHFIIKSTTGELVEKLQTVLQADDFAYQVQSVAASPDGELVALIVPDAGKIRNAPGTLLSVTSFLGSVSEAEAAVNQAASPFVRVLALCVPFDLPETATLEAVEVEGHAESTDSHESTDTAEGGEGEKGEGGKAEDQVEKAPEKPLTKAQKKALAKAAAKEAASKAKPEPVAGAPVQDELEPSVFVLLGTFQA